MRFVRAALRVYSAFSAFSPAITGFAIKHFSITPRYFSTQPFVTRNVLLNVVFPTRMLTT